MSEGSNTSDVALAAVALEKLTRVLGEGRGQRVFDLALRDAGLEKIATPDDLYLFAQKLSAMQGMESAVGGLLSVTAVMRGAASRISR